MSFHSLERLITAIEQQPGWEQQRLYRRTLHSWPALVGSSLARVSRPVSISRNILFVATSSSVVAQDLTMKRYDLLERLDRDLKANFVDLRFSPAKWHAFQTSRKQLGGNLLEPKLQEQDLQQPSVLPLEQGNDPRVALDRLTKTIQQRCRDLPLCPSCQAPTPVSELDRWQVCACCAVANWSDNSSI